MSDPEEAAPKAGGEEPPAGAPDSRTVEEAAQEAAPEGPAEMDATAAEGEEEEDTFMSGADAKLAEANERYLRLAADFDNYRKRAQRESAAMAAEAGEAVMRDLLPVLDNLERALTAASEGQAEGGAPDADAAGDRAEAAGSVAKGVELTLRQFRSALAKNGVVKIKAVGEAFDPRVHEALLQEEREDVKVETVTEELEAGYALRGRVIRPARVKVARPAPAKGDAGE